MTDDNHKRLLQYQEGDFNSRLNLYLQYPALRAQFMVIDQSELNPEVRRCGGRPKQSLPMRLTVLLSTSIGCVRRILVSAKS
ncbi:MAG: hypothetical protein KJP06_08625 [Deltaproteobacteria bacterium]|nr:hypothetical protein [Deltaproteobacteria bacterium]